MKRRLKVVATAALMITIAACAAAPKKKEVAVFFPPAPELPRIQYMAAFTGSKDVQEETAFQRFVLGEKQKVEVDKPYGVAMYDGKIYVCDTNMTVMVFNFKTKSLLPLEGARGPGKLIQPLNISIEKDGTKYVTDPVRGQVVVFDRDDQYVRAYGKPGNWKPVDAVPFEDRLYVADINNGVVKVFDKKTGEIVKTIGDKGEPSQKLDRPTNLAFDQEGHLYVTDTGQFRIAKFDRDGHFISMIGKVGDAPGNFARPKGIVLDREDHLYVVDAAYNNVQMFNKDGRLLMFFGEAGNEPGNLMLPAQVDIDYENVKYFQQYADPSFDVEYLIIVTSQFGPRRVNIFGFGKEKGMKYPTDEELQQLIEKKWKEELEKLKKTENKEESAGKKGAEKAADEGANAVKPVVAPAEK